MRPCGRARGLAGAGEVRRYAGRAEGRGLEEGLAP